MSEEKKLENTELSDETLAEVSGGGSAKFTCNGCGKEVVYKYGDYSRQDGNVECNECKAAYFVEPKHSRVTQIGTYEGVANLIWDDLFH